MAPTIEELDATVRAFYEGRGDTVSFISAVIISVSVAEYMLTRLVNSKKLPKLHSIRYGETSCQRQSCVVGLC
jgi:hypothetical protein